MTGTIEVLVYPTRDGAWRARVRGTVEGVEVLGASPPRATPERAASDGVADWRARATIAAVTASRRAEAPRA